MLGKVLLDNDRFKLTLGLTGKFKATRKERRHTTKATQDEGQLFMQVCGHLLSAGIPAEPGSPIFEEAAEQFASALLPRGDTLWQTYFRMTSEEVAEPYIRANKAYPDYSEAG
jgi:hypothetical protein